MLDAFAAAPVASSATRGNVGIGGAVDGTPDRSPGGSSGETRPGKRSRFDFFPLVTSVLVLALAAGAGADWYGRHVALPRYCAEPEAALGRLEALIDGNRLDESGSRRSHVVAAKLLFLIPREGDEPVGRYIARVRGRLEAQCR